MNLDALNDTPELQHTPLGVLRVHRMRNGDVLVLARHPEGVHERVLYTLGPDANLWDALYGKAPLERRAFDGAAAEARYERARAEERARAAHKQAMGADLGKLLRRHDDFRAAMRALIKPRGA